MEELFETIPNYSVGDDQETIDLIASCFGDQAGVKLLDYSADKDHNRLVVTAVGSSEGLMKSVLESVKIAAERIDMNEHSGEHPRMGAVDVVPFVPVRNVTMGRAIELARQVAEEVGSKFEIPVYLYEEAATDPERKNLAKIRRGEYEGFPQKISKPQWKPDYGPTKVHPTAGVTAIGARKPLIAFNVNLGTENLSIANAIARKVRHSNGGLRYCKAMGVKLDEQGLVQVSMNMTDYTQTSLQQAFQLIESEANRYGVPVVESEIIGMTPADPLLNAAKHYLKLNNFSSDQVIENRLLEDL